MESILQVIDESLIGSEQFYVDNMDWRTTRQEFNGKICHDILV